MSLLVLAADEPSKTPFYIVGGALAAWAVLVAFIGITRPDFPASKPLARIVMAISGVLVAAAMAAAVITS
jgi:hypothetical protein